MVYFISAAAAATLSDFLRDIFWISLRYLCAKRQPMSNILRSRCICTKSKQNQLFTNSACPSSKTKQTNFLINLFLPSERLSDAEKTSYLKYQRANICKKSAQIVWHTTFHLIVRSAIQMISNQLVFLSPAFFCQLTDRLKLSGRAI